MIELLPDQFSSALPLFDKNMPLKVRVVSTLEGRTPGKVYADDPHRPTVCALSLNYYNVTFLGGDINQEWIDSVAADLSRDRELILVWPPQIDAQFKLPAMTSKIVDRFEFYDCPSKADDLSIPTVYQLRRMDKELFARSIWYDEIVSLYGSAENFLQDGIGLCQTDNDEICCEAYAICHDAEMIEIGVITNEKHRNKGFAFATCKNLMQACAAEGFSTYWVCHQTNIASASTARKLGYRLQKEFKWLVIAKSTK